MLGRRALGLALCLVLPFDAVAAMGIWAGPGGGIVFALAPDPSRPGTVYAGAARGGIFQSTDAGRTWRRVTRAPHPTRIEALAVDGAGRIFAGTGSGILESPDSGASWTVVTPTSGAEEVESLAVEHGTSSETVYAGTTAGTILESVDGGKTWRAIAPGLPELAVHAIVPADHVLWAATNGGIFRGIGRGRGWEKANAFAGRTLVVDRAHPDTILVANEALFRSTDAGVTWSKVPGIRYALSLAIDSSTSPGTVYVGTSYDGVLKSTDGGAWIPARTGLGALGEVVELAIDTRTEPATLYAATSQLGVYRSTDGGASWLADEGLTAVAPRPEK